MTHEQEQNQEIAIYDVPEAKVFIKDNVVYIDNKEYTIVENYKNALDSKSLEDRYTALLQKYHYIVGDWGHEQLRLKGFYDNDTKHVEDDQKIRTLQDYLLEYCAFGCAYFVLALNGTPEPFIDVTEKTPRRRPRRRKETQHATPKMNEQAAKKTAKNDTKPQQRSFKKGNTQPPKQSKHAFVIRKGQGE